MYSILPASVANELRQQRPIPARKYQKVSLLFSGIVGFSDFCARNADHEGAMKIVKLLNNCYTTFDSFVDPSVHQNIYKVDLLLEKQLKLKLMWNVHQVIVMN